MDNNPIFGAQFAQLPSQLFAHHNATPVKEPGWIAFNQNLAHDLQLNHVLGQNEKALSIFAGNAVAQGTSPLAMAYAGHQFGHWSPQLGDGRALLLGDVQNAGGQRFDVQLKGSGPTPFSRNGDGRAALGPVLREYVISEAMHALGVPTTRALAAVVTGEVVRRDMALPGAIITRVAKSFVRVGTFQYFAARADKEALLALVDFSIARHEMDLKGADNPPLALLSRVVARQAELIVKWQLLGFIHGVMNTDNMSVGGETIDYGPCALMDEYDPATVFSSIDQYGRYAYENQPRIAQWNLMVLAQSLLSVFDEDGEKALELAQEAINGFASGFDKAFRRGLLAKIGIADERFGDYDLALDLLDIMKEARADFTNSFRALSDMPIEKTELDADLLPFKDWINRWKNHTDSAARIDQGLMQAVNPFVIPRNHRVEQMIEGAMEGDFSRFEAMMRVLSQPFKANSAHQYYTLPPAPAERVLRTFCGT